MITFDTKFHYDDFKEYDHIFIKVLCLQDFRTLSFEGTKIIVQYPS